MAFLTSEFNQVIHRIAAGDRQARGQFSVANTPHLARIIKRAAVQGDQASALGKRLLQTARGLDQSVPPADMAGRMMGLILDQLQPGSTETFCPLATREGL